jgi:hypothetical protein
MGPEVGIAVFFGMIFSIMTGGLGVAVTLALESQGKNVSDNVYGTVFVVYLVVLILSGFFAPAGVLAFFALVLGAYVAAAGITSITAKPRIQGELEFAKKLSSLGANLLEEYDLDRDGLISPADVSRIYQTAPTGSDKQVFAQKLLGRLNQIGHNIAADGNGRFCVVNAADVAGYLARVEKLHESWFGPTKTENQSGSESRQ